MARYFYTFNDAAEGSTPQGWSPIWDTSNVTWTVASDTPPTTNIYRFDAHQGISNPDFAWDLQSNAFDSIHNTYASLNTSTTANNPNVNYLQGTGTTAPSSNSNTILGVRFRINAGTQTAGLSTTGRVATSTDEILGTATDITDSGTAYGSWVNLSTPTNGWTWQKLRDLKVRFYSTNAFTPDIWSVRAGIAEIEVIHTSTPNAARYLRNTNSSVNDKLLANTDIGQVADLEVAVKFRTNQNGQYENTLFMRASATNSNKQGYYVALNLPASQTKVLNNEQWYNNGYLPWHAYNFDWQPNTWYWIRWRVIGNNHKSKFWVDGQAEPGWMSDRNDTTGTQYNSAGYFALAAYSSGGARDWDFVGLATGGDTAPTAPIYYHSASLSGDSDMTVSATSYTPTLHVASATMSGDSNVVANGNTSVFTDNLAQTAYDNTYAVGEDPVKGAGFTRMGQSFIAAPGQTSMSAIKLWLMATGATPGNFIVRVYNSVAEANSGATPLATSVTINPTNDSVKQYTIPLLNTIPLTPGNSYFFTTRSHVEYTYVGFSFNDVYSDGARWTVAYGGAGGSTLLSQDNGDVAFVVSSMAAGSTGSSSMSGDSDVTVSGYRVKFGDSSFSGDSDITVSAQRTSFGTSSFSGDSDVSALGMAGFFVIVNQEGDSTMTVEGAKAHYGEVVIDGDSEIPDVQSSRNAISYATLSGDSDLILDSGGIDVTHLAITKSYLYKIYDEDWNYLGIWKDVISDFGYSQEINSAGSAITVTLARNSDSLIPDYDSIATDNDETILTDSNDEIAAEMTTVNAVGPGTTVDLNKNVKIYEFSTDPTQEVEGDLVFTGYISMYRSKYGSTENTDVSVFSYGADLDNWVLTEEGNTRVSYISEDPSEILKDTLDKFQAEGGLISYDVGVPGDTEVVTNLITNPSFETNTNGWSLLYGVGGRQSGSGGVFGTYYYGIQNMSGGIVSHDTGNLEAGNIYRLSFYLRRPASGTVNIFGYHNSASVFDYYVNPPSAWTRFDIQFTATANSPLGFQIGISGSDNVVYIDGVMLTKGPTLYDYFDGTTVSTEQDVSYSWSGTAHNSTSLRTKVINNEGATIENTQWTHPGWIATYAFNVNTELEVMKKCLELAPTDWFFYVDMATNLVHFHPRPSEPQHYFYLGKHIYSLDLEKNMEGIVNDVILTGGKPTNVVRDTFNDVNGELLQNHQGEVGATWVKHPQSSTGQMRIQTNRAYHETGSDLVYLVSGETTSNDYTVTVDMRVISNIGDNGIIGRADPMVNTYYMGRVNPSGVAEIYKRINGTFTLLKSTPFTAVPGNTYKVELKMEGIQISLRIDDDTIVDVEDSSIVYGTRSGFRTTGTQTATTGYHFNNFSVKHFGDSGSPVFRRKINQDSISSYRRGLARIQDNRVTVDESAELLMDSQLDRNAQPRYRSKITISGSTYDIRSIKLGDLVGFRNFNNFIDDPDDPVWMQVVRIDYSGDSVTLQLDTLLPSVPKRIEDIKRNLAQSEVEENPDAPTLST